MWLPDVPQPQSIHLQNSLSYKNILTCIILAPLSEEILYVVLALEKPQRLKHTRHLSITSRVCNVNQTGDRMMGRRWSKERLWYKLIQILKTQILVLEMCRFTFPTETSIRPCWWCVNQSQTQTLVTWITVCSCFLFCCLQTKLLPEPRHQDPPLQPHLQPWPLLLPYGPAEGNIQL